MYIPSTQWNKKSKKVVNSLLTLKGNPKLFGQNPPCPNNIFCTFPFLSNTVSKYEILKLTQ